MNNTRNRIEVSTTGSLYTEIIEHYNKTIVGQDHVKHIMAKVISSAYQDLPKKKGPIAVIGFKGSTGVGKSEFAKQTSQILYGVPNGAVRVDCDQLTQSHDSAVLFGAPPGYLGYDKTPFLDPSRVYAAWQEGQKNNTLHKIARRNQFLSLIVFEEIEKAHPQILQTLLQATDEDYITLKNGKDVFLGNAIIIYTMNVGEKVAANSMGSVGFSTSSNNEQVEYEKREKIKDDILKRTFSPEFLGRIDYMATFDPVNESMLKTAIEKYQYDLMYEVLTKTNGNVGVQYSDDVFHYIKEKVETGKGLRNLDKVWNQQIRYEVGSLLKIQHLDRGDQKHVLDVEIEGKTLKFFLSEATPDQIVVMQNTKMIPLQEYKKTIEVSGTDEEKTSLPAILALVAIVQKHAEKKEQAQPATKKRRTKK